MVQNDLAITTWPAGFACALIEHSPKLYEGQKWRDGKTNKSMSLWNFPAPEAQSVNSSFGSERESVATGTGHCAKLLIHKKWW